MKLKIITGYEIQECQNNTPLHRDGFRDGDVLIAVNGTAISDIHQIAAMLDDPSIDDITVVRLSSSGIVIAQEDNSTTLN